RITGAHAEPAVVAGRVSRSHCGQTAVVVVVYHSLDGKENCVVADDHRAEPRRFDPDCGGGDSAGFRVRVVSGDPAGEVHPVFPDPGGIRGGAGGSVSSSALCDVVAGADVRGGGDHGDVGISLLGYDCKPAALAVKRGAQTWRGMTSRK